MSLIIFLLVSLLLGSTPACAGHKWFAKDPPLLGLGTGAAQIFDRQQELYWGVEYRPAFRLCHFGPWFLFGTGKQHEFYAAAGMLLNLELGNDWVLTPSFGGGYYNAGNGLDLGFDNEFRTGIELAKRFRNEHRLGVSFAHLSNGSLSDKNPGTETFGVVYSLPLDFLFRRAASVSVPEPAQ